MKPDAIRTRMVPPGGMERPGDYIFDEERENIYIILPGMKSPDAIPILEGRSDAPGVWSWNGSEESPTLTPSLLIVGGWHGYLTDGELKSC